MNYILDTHYILWTLFEPNKISDTILEIFKDENHSKTVSGISLWEISLKFSLGKLELHGTNPDEIYEKVIESGFDVIPIENEILVSYYKLPKKNSHRDPFDRLLIWQAINANLILITNDKLIEQYIEDGLNLERGR
jgi:PIN domain nuclease of toxin-antitoxin system